jgi:L-ribulose-5-phosphate 3-epimerase
MKKAINQWCFPSEWSWERVFGLCEQAEFKGIELCIDYLPFFETMARGPQEGLIADIAKSVGSSFADSKALRFDSPEKDFAVVAAMARDHGVAVTSLLTIAQFHYSLVSDDPALRSTGIDLVRRMLELAALTGAPNLLVVPGVVTSRIGYEDAYRRLEDAIGLLKVEAEKVRVGLGIENVWGKFLYSPLEMRALIDKFASLLVGVHFDVGNVMQFGHPDQWIRILGRRLLNIHLKDYVESINNIRAFTWLFQGSVPWDRVMTALRDVGYDGYLIAEVPPYPYAPEEGIWDVSRKIDILLERS